MRLPSLLLLTSSALFACRVAATASELASAPHSNLREHSVRNTIANNKLRRAVREEERNTVLSPEEENAIAHLRKMAEKIGLLSTSDEDVEPLVHYLQFYQELKTAYGSKETERVDWALKLAERLADDDHLQTALNQITAMRADLGSKLMDDMWKGYQAAERKKQHGNKH